MHDNITAGKEPPMFKLQPEKVLFDVPADGDLPAESVRVHRHTRVFTSTGEDVASAQRLVEAILRSKRVRNEFGKEGTPAHKAFVVELSYADKGPEEMLYLHKLEPSKLRPIVNIRIHGRAEFDQSAFPVQDDQEPKVRVTWNTGKRDKLSIRFGVRSATDNCSQVWTVVTERGRGRSDIFVTSHSLRKAFKISLHESGSWQYGYTEEYTRNPEYSRVAARERRHWEIWDRPTDFAPGITRAIQIVIPPSAARDPCAEDAKSVTWAAVPGADEAVEFNVLLMNPARPVAEWPGKNSMGTLLAGTFELENGEIVWVVYRNVPIPRFDDVRVPATFIRGLDAKDGGQYSIILAGHAKDGSRFIFDAPIDLAALKHTVETAETRPTDP